MNRPNLKRLRVCNDLDGVERFTLDSENFEIADLDLLGQAAYENSLKAISWEFESGEYAFSKKAAHYAKIHKINPEKLFVAWDRYVRQEISKA